MHIVRALAGVAMTEAARALERITQRGHRGRAVLVADYTGCRCWPGITMNPGTEFMFIHTDVINVGNELLGWPWRGGFRWFHPAISACSRPTGSEAPICASPSIKVHRRTLLLPRTVPAGSS